MSSVGDLGTGLTIGWLLWREIAAATVIEL